MNKQKLLICSLALSLTTLLNACGSNTKKFYAGDEKTDCEITYNLETNELSWKIPTSAMDYIKVVTFKYGDVTFTKLVIIEDWLHSAGGRIRISTYILKYVDLESGTILIHALGGSKEDALEYKVGEDITILDEKPILPYLYEAGIFKDTYEINEIIDFYQKNKDKIIDDMSLNLAKK